MWLGGTTSTPITSQDRIRQAYPVGGPAKAAASGAVRPVACGIGCSGGTQGAGVEEGRAQRDGDTRRRWAGLAANTTVGPSALAAGCPGAPRSNTPTPPATTAGAGSGPLPWSSGGAPECYGSRSRAEYTDTSAKPTIRPYWIGTCRARHWAGKRHTTRDRAR